VVATIRVKRLNSIRNEGQTEKKRSSCETLLEYLMKKSATLGERKIIKIIQDQLDRMPRMPIPFGDDVSAYDLGNGRLAVLKTDMLVAGTDVPKTMSLWQAARKAVVMNVSDFAAKGAKPLALMVSLGLPRGLTKTNVEEIGKGLNAGAREYDTYILGGDTGEASDLIINVSVFGMADKADIMLRSGARPEDIVAVTGPFGKTAAGLKILSGGFQAARNIRKTLMEPVLMPHARLAEGLALSKTKTVTSAIDSSDGLAWSLHEIARASNVGFLINKLPTAREAKTFAKSNKLNPAELTLYGGEEYELVLTIRRKDWQTAMEAAAKAGGNLMPIGRVTAERRMVLRKGGKTYTIRPKGYEHFKASTSSCKVDT
jgi:thiamine-monophosphate kinase